MSRNRSKPDSPAPQRRRISLWKKLLFATVVCVAFFAVVELTLSAMGMPTLIEREDPFRGFSGLVTVFVRDGEVYRTRPGSLPTFNDQSFLANKPANGLRIFCLGGSSSYGFPWGAEIAFTAILGDALAASHPELHVETVNVSGVSYAMHRLNIVADELLAYEPDVFLVYSGHNEFIEPAFFEALKHRSAARTRLEYLLAHTRLYSAMRSGAEDLRRDTPSTSEQFDARVRREESHVYSRQDKEAIVAEYRWRLERLVRRAQAAGVKVVLATVPCNLRDWRPNASTIDMRLGVDAERQRSEAFAAGKRQLNRGDYAAAIVSLEHAAHLAAGHAETQFLLAQSYERMERWDDSRSAYQRASDADASPTRRVSGINEAIRDVPVQHGALLVDVDRIFEQRSEHGLVGFNLIEDYVHPTREGHELIAWNVWKAMEGASWLGNEPVAQRALFDRLLAVRRQRPVTENAAWLYNQGVVLAQQGQKEAAIEKYRQALAASPDYSAAMHNLGKLLKETGKFDEAVELCERLVAIDPANAVSRNVLGNSLQELGRFEEAITHYQEALRLKPDYTDAHFNLGVALQSLRRFEEAVTHYKEALRLKPEYATAHFNLGAALQSLGRFAEAVAHYQEALQLKPDYTDAHFNLGVAQQSLRRFEEAVKHFKEALRLKPDFARAHNECGNGLRRLGRFEEAVAHYQEALRLKPDFAEAHNNCGKGLRHLGRFEEAVAHYKEALRLKPDYVVAHANLGAALQSVGHYEEAVTHYNEALRLKPDFAEAHVNLGSCLQSLGRFEEAIAHHQEALRVKPALAEAHVNLGACLQSLGRFHEAIARYQEALRLKPDYIPARSRIAWLLATCPDAQVRDGQQAVDLAQRMSSATGHRNSAMLDILAAAHAELGSFDEAVRWQEKAVQLAPEPRSEVLRQRLELYRSRKPFREVTQRP